MDSPRLPYQYETLSPREIRVVILYPLNENDEIHCNLKRVFIDEYPAYEAISYAWGDANDRIPISVGSGTLQVTQNLYAALRALSPQEAERIIWVDAVCINQSDTSEKNHQVQFMREVYARASCVVIWLGPAADGSDDVMDYLGSLLPETALKQHRKFMYLGPETWNWVAAEPRDQLPIFMKKLDHLISRSWFSRIWVIQEAVVSRKACFVCGGKIASWEQMFSLAWSMFNDHRNDSLHNLGVQRGVSPVSTILFIQSLRYDKIRVSLEQVLEISIGSKATDPRDRIYAVQNLANEPGIESLLLKPDYNRTVSQVYTDIAVRFYEVQNGHILKLSGRARQNIIGLPSWVIDWTSASNALPLYSFNAHGVSEISFKVSNIGDGVRRLVLQGSILSTISTMIDTPTMPPWSNSFYKPEVLEALRDRFAACASLVQSGRNSEKKSHNQKNLWRVPVYDFTYLRRGRYPADYDEDLTEFPAWISSYSTESNPDIPSPYLSHLRELGLRTGAFVTRQFAMDSMDNMCMVPHITRPGDLILIVAGFGLPVVVRAVQEKLYEIIGTCYVHGYMDGEAFNEDPNRPFEEFVFC